MFSAYTCRLTLILLFVNCLQTFLSLETEIQTEEEDSCDQISNKYFFQVSIVRTAILIHEKASVWYKVAKCWIIKRRETHVSKTEVIWRHLLKMEGDLHLISAQFNIHVRKNYWVGLRPNLLMWNASAKLTAAKMICMVNYSNDMLVKVWQDWLVIQLGFGNLREILSQSQIVYLRNHSRNCFNTCCMVL